MDLGGINRNALDDLVLQEGTDEARKYFSSALDGPDQQEGTGGSGCVTGMPSLTLSVRGQR